MSGHEGIGGAVACVVAGLWIGGAFVASRAGSVGEDAPQHSAAGEVRNLSGCGDNRTETPHLEERTSAAAAKTNALPEILLIGDSIRMGYCRDVAKALEGRATVKWPDGNCANSQNILINLGWWRQCASSPAVVQFNSGHWDASHWDGDDEQITSVGEYAKNVRLIIRRLRRYYPKAKIVYATTTPMNPSGLKGGNRRTTEEIRRYNAAGIAVARAEGVAVNDLFSFVEKWPASDYQDYCHFTPAANVRLGRHVAEVLHPLPAATNRTTSAVIP